MDGVTADSIFNLDLFVSVVTLTETLESDNLIHFSNC